MPSNSRSFMVIKAINASQWAASGATTQVVARRGFEARPALSRGTTTSRPESVIPAPAFLVREIMPL